MADRDSRSPPALWLLHAHRRGGLEFGLGVSSLPTGCIRRLCQRWHFRSSETTMIYFDGPQLEPPCLFWTPTMTKLAIWILVLAGITVPVLLSLVSMSFQSTSMPSRYGSPQTYGADPALHDTYFYIEFLGRRLSINPSIYPAILLITGAVFIVLGIYWMLHIDNCFSPIDIPK